MSFFFTEKESFHGRNFKDNDLIVSCLKTRPTETRMLVQSSIDATSHDKTVIYPFCLVLYRHLPDFFFLNDDNINDSLSLCNKDDWTL